MTHAYTLPNIEPQLTARPVHPGTRIGHVHLKVANLDRALAFYGGVLGFACASCTRLPKACTRRKPMLATFFPLDGWSAPRRKAAHDALAAVSDPVGLPAGHVAAFESDALGWPHCPRVHPSTRRAADTGSTAASQWRIATSRCHCAACCSGHHGHHPLQHRSGAEDPHARSPSEDVGLPDQGSSLRGSRSITLAKRVARAAAHQPHSPRMLSAPGFRRDTSVLAPSCRQQGW